MIDKLISIKKFANDLLAPYSVGAMKDYSYLVNYIWLLDKTLELGQFVPCVDGVPFEKPLGYDNYKQYGRICDFNTEQFKNCKEYKEAESNVLFKGLKR